jgi:type VI secretion system ImpM family protein
MSRWLEGASLIGKVSWEYEFLRGPRHSTAISAFDEWLFRNAAACDRSGWFAAAEPAAYGFVMQIEPGGRAPVLAGAVGPSRDRAGRAYPAAIVSSVALDDAAAHPEVLPILLEDYWQRAVEALAWARTTSEGADEGHLQDITGRPIEPCSNAAALYVDWTHRTTPLALCGMLDRSPPWLEHAVDALASVARPQRQGAQAAGAPRCAVRVPLGRAAGAALCFWIDVVWRAAGGRGSCPSFFWSHDAQSGDALLSLPIALDTTLTTLWSGVPRGEEILDLTREYVPSPDASPTPPSVLGIQSLGAGGDGAVSAILEMVG